ncbi:MAG: hypothetical protein WCA91_23035, partial [Candidatus Acidiferrales bacterium]
LDNGQHHAAEFWFEYQRSVVLTTRHTNASTDKLQLTPQWRVGTYRIDLVVEANHKRMAVECDRYHPLDKLGEDMERQAVLERMGWIFVLRSNSR